MASEPFTTEPIVGGTRYRLPRRVLGKGRYAGLAIAGFGLLITAFMVFWMWGPTSSGIEMVREGEWFGWLLIGFGLLGLGGLIPGLAMLGGGLLVLLNGTRTEVQVRDDQLISIERVGPVRWKQERPIDRIDQLRLTAALSSRRNRRRDAEPIDLFDDAAGEGAMTIEAVGKGIKPLKIAPGYPIAMLRPLAEELAGRANAAGPAKLFDRNKRVEIVEVEPASRADPDEADRRHAADQPADSRITIDRRDDGLTLHVPPSGVWKSSAGLFSFGLIWTAFCLVFFGGMLAMAIFGGEFESDLPGIWGPIAVVAFAMVFFGVGIAMLVAGWNMGRRRAVIDIVGDALLYTEVAPLKTRQMEWSADQLRAIKMGPSGIESNDKPIMCLRIEPRRGETVKLLTGRAEDELDWLAAVLRVELGSGEAAEPNVPIDTGATGRAAQPPDSMIGVDRAGDRVTFAVPARGLGKVWPMVLIGLVFFVVGVGVWIGVAGSELADGFQWSDIMAVGFISLWALIFAGAGGAVGLGGLVMARRRYLIEVDRAKLAVERFGPFGRRRDEWPTDRIRSITVKFSGTQSGNQRYHELVIKPTRGRTCKIGNGRPPHELNWLAAALKHELRTAGQSPEDA